MAVSCPLLEKLAQHQRNYDNLVPGEFEGLLADGARATRAAESIPPGWTSPSIEAFILGGGIRLLGSSRRGASAFMLLVWFGFLLDNPVAHGSVRVSIELLCLTTRRLPVTTRRYLELLDAADMLRTGPDDTYSRGIWFPYPAITGDEFREDLRP